MQLDADSGLIDAADFRPSPNCDDRPEANDISLIVIHGISLPPGEYGGPYIDRLFANQLDAGAHPYFEKIHGLRVSSHLLIRRNGELVQYVPLHKRAWHAGESSYEGRSACNDFSIGIELEGVDDSPYEEVQYETLVEVIRLLCDHYEGLSVDRVVGHCDISPGRKTDPGEAFDWDRLRQVLAG